MSCEEQKYIKIKGKSNSVFIYYNFNKEKIILTVFVCSPPSIFHSIVFLYLFPAILGVTK